MKALFESRRWYAARSGSGRTPSSPDGFGTFGADDYVTAAATPDGTLAMAYVPSSRTHHGRPEQLSGPSRHAGTTPPTARSRPSRLPVPERRQPAIHNTRHERSRRRRLGARARGRLTRPHAIPVLVQALRHHQQDQLNVHAGEPACGRARRPRARPSASLARRDGPPRFPRHRRSRRRARTSPASRGRRSPGLVHARERKPVRGRLAALQRRHDDGVFLPRLQQRDPHDERGRIGDLHLHRGNTRRGGQPGPVPDRSDRDDRDHDRRRGHRRHHQHHGQRRAASADKEVAEDQCKDGGWQNFTGPSFKNQGDCVSYFATGGSNPGNG